MLAAAGDAYERSTPFHSLVVAIWANIAIPAKKIHRLSSSKFAFGLWGSMLQIRLWRFPEVSSSFSKGDQMKSIQLLRAIVGVVALVGGCSDGLITNPD